MDAITLILPEDVPAAVVREVEGEIAEMGEVEAVEKTQTRAIDVAGLLLVVSLASDALGVASVAADLFEKIKNRISGKGIKGAEIELPNGVKIKLDSASVEEIQQLVSQWKAEE